MKITRKIFVISILLSHILTKITANGLTVAILRHTLHKNTDLIFQIRVFYDHKND